MSSDFSTKLEQKAFTQEHQNLDQAITKRLSGLIERSLDKPLWQAFTAVLGALYTANDRILVNRARY